MNNKLIIIGAMNVFLFSYTHSIDLPNVLLNASALWAIPFAVNIYTTQLSTKLVLLSDIEQYKEYALYNIKNAFIKKDYVEGVIDSGRILFYSMNAEVSKIKCPKNRALLGFLPLSIMLLHHLIYKKC